MSKRKWSKHVRLLVLSMLVASGMAACSDSKKDGDDNVDPSQALAALNARLAEHGLIHRTLFSVDQDAVGLPGTGVADAAPNAQSHLFVSSNKGPSEVAGSNQIIAVPSELDLAPTDKVDAVSTLHPLNTVSPYYFSVTDIANAPEGLEGTHVRRESDESEVPGDIFYSTGFGSKPNPGTNFLFTDEVRVGLQPEQTGGDPKDNLDAVDFLYRDPPGLVYFSVGRGTAGIETVAGVAEAERACTIFSTMLGSGLVEVAYTCADLGLVAGDNIDAMVLRGSTAPSVIIFSVDAESTGETESDVDSEQSTDGAQADLFESAGTGTHRLKVEELSLGLEDETDADELDALTVADLSLPGYITRLPPPPEDPPPYTDPPEGVDPGDSEAYLPLWELALLVGPRNAENYADGETVPHPCTSCEISAQAPKPETRINTTAVHWGPVVNTQELFSSEGPFKHYRFDLDDDDDEIVITGECFNDRSFEESGDYYISVVSTDAAPSSEPDRRKERACGYRLRTNVYAPQDFPRDNFTNTSHIQVERFDQGRWQQVLFNAGETSPESLSNFSAHSCSIRAGGTTVSFINATDLQQAGADAVGRTASQSYKCFAFEASQSSPFGLDGDYFMSLAPKGDTYFDDGLLTTPTCEWVSGGQSVTIYGQNSSETIGVLPPTVNFDVCDINDDDDDVIVVDDDDGVVIDDRLLNTPVNITLAPLTGVPRESGALCQNLVIGGGVGFSLQPAGFGTCPGGAAYLSFHREDTSSVSYGLYAGELFDDQGNSGPAVSLESTTAGTIQNVGGMDVIMNLPDGTDITVTTQDHTITFRFDGSTLTVSNFEAR